MIRAVQRHQEVLPMPSNILAAEYARYHVRRGASREKLSRAQAASKMDPNHRFYPREEKMHLHALK